MTKMSKIRQAGVGTALAAALAIGLAVAAAGPAIAQPVAALLARLHLGGL